MATQEEINAKRASVDALRAEIAAEKQARAAADAAANHDYRLSGLAAEELSLQAELAALRGQAAAPAPAPEPAPEPPKPSSDDAAKNKE
jgi:hypothetical protein